METIASSVTVVQWTADPAGSLKATVDFIGSLPPVPYSWGSILAAGVIAAPFVLKFAKLVPGVGPYVSAIGGFVENFLASKDAKEKWRLIEEAAAKYNANQPVSG